MARRLREAWCGAGRSRLRQVTSFKGQLFKGQLVVVVTHRTLIIMCHGGQDTRAMWSNGGANVCPKNPEASWHSGRVQVDYCNAVAALAGVADAQHKGATPPAPISSTGDHTALWNAALPSSSPYKEQRVQRALFISGWRLAKPASHRQKGSGQPEMAKSCARAHPHATEYTAVGLSRQDLLRSDGKRVMLSSQTGMTANSFAAIRRRQVVSRLHSLEGNKLSAGEIGARWLTLASIQTFNTDESFSSSWLKRRDVAHPRRGHTRALRLCNVEIFLCCGEGWFNQVQGGLKGVFEQGNCVAWPR